MTKPDKMNQILMSPCFQEFIKKNQDCEHDRIFCRHGLDHALDVARIAYIVNLEQGLGYTKDLIYSMALLHDIGKWQEYADGTPHDEASAALAGEILTECGFTEAEASEIREAILLHRSQGTADSTLRHLLYYADKKSRSCFSCAAAKECYWKEEKRNHLIVY